MCSPPSQGKAAPNYSCGSCNPVNFTVLKPPDYTREKVISIRINEKGLDPESLMHLKLVTVTHESSSYQVFHSFYEEMRNKFSISAKAKNLFLSLAESIAQTLNATSCCVCQGTNMGDHWAWKKMTNSLLSKSSSTMVLPPRQKMGPGATALLYICLNHVIRLQAVVEIITNETARALNLLAKQSTKMCNASYQNHLALGYLLASEEKSL
jgi:hypothetical protein